MIGHGQQTNYFYGAPAAGDRGAARPPRIAFSGEVDSPYRGLLPFEERDAALFFGRATAADKILQLLSGLLSAVPALMVVSGVSGAGKSSLLRAGVLPRIAEVGHGLTPAAGAAPWPHPVLTPARAPLTELSDHVAPLVSTDAATLRQTLRADPSGFALTALEAARARQGPGARREPHRLLLVVDQFEQVFTQCTDEGERRAFITALHAAAATGHGPDQVPAAMVILVVRADFEARCTVYEELAEAVQNRYLVLPMTRDELRMAITAPAQMAESAVAGALVEELVRAASTTPSPTASAPTASGAGVLPHLSHALDQAWRIRAGDEITLADYARAGGIERSIAVSAERAYESLPPARRETAREVFIRLTATSPEGMDTADRCTKAELTEGKTPDQAADVEAVLEKFAAERLLTLAEDSVEISHDSLLAAWPRLRDTWLTKHRDDRITRTRLRDAVAEWVRNSRDPSYLYRGTVLQTAAETAEKIAADPAHHPPLTQDERDFLRAGDGARRRTARWRRTAITGLAVLTGAALATAVIAVLIAATAAQQHATALSRQLAAQSLTTDLTDPVTARQLAVAAWSVAHTTEANSAMTTLLAEQSQQGMLPAEARTGLDAVAFSPDGQLLATADWDGTVRLWNPATSRPVGSPLTLSGNGIGTAGVAFSPNGKLLASAVSLGSGQLWDAATRRPVGDPLPVDTTDTTGTGGGAGVVAFSPDGTLLATAGSDGTVRLWNPATSDPAGAPLRAVRGGAVDGVAFSPDGTLLATADSDGTVRLWNPATGHAVGTPLRAVRGGAVDGVAFSPDGTLLATADSDGTVRLWNPATRQPVGAPLPAVSGGDVDGVAFSPDGTLLASAGSDGTVRLWNPATGHAVGAPLRAVRSGVVDGVAFSPDGKLLASADSDGVVRLWNPATGQPTGAPLRADRSGVVNGVAFSPDGKLLATADEDGTVRVWDPATSQEVGAPLLAVRGGTVDEVAFSPDGKLVATVGSDGTVRLWNPETGRTVGTSLAVSGISLSGVAFSPDGKLVATAGSDGTARLWDLATRRPVRALLRAGGGQAVFGVAFSPDGKLLATVGSDSVRLWDSASGQPAGTLLPVDRSLGVYGVAFSPDGKLLAGADGDGTVQLWDPATGREVGAPLRASGSVRLVAAVAFSPDGKLLASADSDGTVRLWDPATGREVGAPLPADTAGPVLTVAFSPDGKLLASAGRDGTVRLWKLPLFTNPYPALCADVGPLTQGTWDQYTSGEPFPKVCP
jgi:WD40 repeat protein